MVVGDVEPGGAADLAGLKTGDVITKLGDKLITKLSDFHSQAAVMFIDDELDMHVVRDGRRKVLDLALTENTQQQILGRRIDRRLTGTEFENFWNPDDGQSSGVLATYVDSGSSAYGYGLRAGDIIVGVNQTMVRDIAQLRDAVLVSKAQLNLRIYRNGRFGQLVIR